MSEMRTVLVTGANKGIGLEIARQLTARGMRVFMAVRNRAAGDEVAAGTPGAEVITLDVSQPASIHAGVAELTSRVDRLDVLVNNAGILLDDSTGVLELTIDTLWQTLETNLAGPLRLTQACLPLLRKSHAPRVINMSSTAGQLAGGLQDWAPAYSISKTALNSLTQHFAAALPAFAVNAVSPGWVRTEMGGDAAPLSVAQGADTTVWLATEAPQSLTGKFLREREEIAW
jgi:NAD(P)-dependent dehydrogenase (short-subunit alcohol dehydrogenase family)